MSYQAEFTLAAAAKSAELRYEQMISMISGSWTGEGKA
jgi:hypothetical protein